MSEPTVKDLVAVFEPTVKDAFGFLEDAYGCEIVAVHDEGGHGMSITYANDTTGVDVDLAPRDGEVAVYLIRLVEGNVPDYLDHAATHWIRLEELLLATEPGRRRWRKRFGDWLTRDDVERIVRESADTVRRVGDGVLRGDFSVFAVVNDRPLTDEEPYDVGSDA